MIEAGFILAFAVLGAFYRRWFGGGFFSAPKIIRVGVGIALGFAVALVMQPVGGEFMWWAWPLVAGLIVGVGWIPGHGSYMDMGMANTPDDEFLKPILDAIFGGDDKIGSTKRDFTGMSLRYLAVSIPLGAAAAGPGLVLSAVLHYRGRQDPVQGLRRRRRHRARAELAENQAHQRQAIHAHGPSQGDTSHLESGAASCWAVR